MTLALLLIAHGSREVMANDDLVHLAVGLRQRGFAIVQPCYLELAEPDIMTAGARCVERGADRVILVPYFLSAGVHVNRDLIAARDRLAKRFPQVHFHLAEPLGRHAALLEVVLDRIREADSSMER